jgi:hypothetical protein
MHADAQSSDFHSRGAYEKNVRPPVVPAPDVVIARVFSTHPDRNQDQRHIFQINFSIVAHLMRMNQLIDARARPGG